MSGLPLRWPFVYGAAQRTMSNRIHVLIDGEQFGPYPETEFRQHLADQKILRSDLVWREGLADWIPAAELLANIERARTAAPAIKPVAQRAGRSVQEELAAAANAGEAEAQFQLSGMLFAGQDVARDENTAAQWLRRAAEAGHSEAQHALGLRHANGEAVPQSDLEAVAWFRKAADQNHAVAQCALGYMLDLGRGAPTDYAEAAHWYRKAAERGDAIAENNLAMLLAAGQGVPRNDAEATNWFRKAAEQGVPGAQTNLGLRYAKGEGLPQDYVEAYKWFLLASARGHAGAVKNRDLLSAQLSTDQVAEAQRRAALTLLTREAGLTRPKGGACAARS